MKRFAFAVLVLALVGAGVYLFVRDTPFESAPRPVEDRAFVIGGHPTTCSQLMGQACGFDLQTVYNDVGGRLEGFVHTADLGPYADRIGVAASAKLSLQACVLARTSGKRSSNSSMSANPPTPTPAVRNCSRSGTVRVRNCAPCIGTAGDEPACGGVATLPRQGPTTTGQCWPSVGNELDAHRGRRRIDDEVLAHISRAHSTNINFFGSIEVDA